MANFKHKSTGQVISSGAFLLLPYYEREKYREVPVERETEDFISSAVIGAVTDSAIIGGLLGGSMTGGILGDLFNGGDLFD